MLYQAGFALRYINVFFTPSFGQYEIGLLQYIVKDRRPSCFAKLIAEILQSFYLLVHL